MVRTRVTAAVVAAVSPGRRRGGGTEVRQELRLPGGPTAQELGVRASRALVATDDAVQTSEQELGFATARVGAATAAPFSAALEAARAELAAAFRLHQQLDDGIPADDATRQSYLADISARCAEASRVLDEHSEAFDLLQDLEARTPQLLAEVDTLVAQQAARVSASRQILDRLATGYSPQAIGTVATNPRQASQRLDFAAATVASSRHNLAAGRSGRTAALLQAAESAADQATDLLNAVEHVQAQLTQAASALPAALREADAEIAAAAALLTDRPGGELASLAARAHAVTAEARARQTAGRLDTLVTLRDVQQADAALDHALAGARARRDNQERARALLDQTMLVARSAVITARDFITTRRGGVGAAARTRLAEARRHFQQAIGYARDDPEAAVTEAERADVLAQQALTAAEQDVARFGYHAGDGGAGSRGEVEHGPAGAIFGGILIAGRSGGIGPGSFGGIGTRGRRSIGASVANLSLVTAHALR
jgi:hypothetical protein